MSPKSVQTVFGPNLGSVLGTFHLVSSKWLYRFDEKDTLKVIWAVCLDDVLAREGNSIKLFFLFKWAPTVQSGGENAVNLIK